MRRNYSELRLRPEQFAEYLLSSEVGFASSEQLAVPQHTSRGKHFGYVYTVTRITLNVLQLCNYGHQSVHLLLLYNFFCCFSLCRILATYLPFSKSIDTRRSSVSSIIVSSYRFLLLIRIHVLYVQPHTALFHETPTNKATSVSHLFNFSSVQSYSSFS